MLYSMIKQVLIPTEYRLRFYGDSLTSMDAPERAFLAMLSQDAEPIVVEPSHRDVNQLFVKRFMDMLGAGLGLILLSPLLLLIIIGIKLTSRGPIFYKQTRVGLGGQTFSLYKFRSMVVNADELKASLQDQNEKDGPIFKIKNDPRITKLGQFLRKYSLDELPQLINVLKNDMSLVGPRPPVPEEVKCYADWQMRRLSIQPGLTCIWQTSGRSNISFEEWMRMDLHYIDHWNIILDIKLILKTILVVVTAEGAY